MRHLNAVPIRLTCVFIPAGFTYSPAGLPINQTTKPTFSKEQTRCKPLKMLCTCLRQVRLLELCQKSQP